MAQRRLSWIGVVLFWVFRLIWTSLVVLAPTIGVWVASSLAAYRNGPVWLACAAGLLLFPVLPVLWDMASEWRRRRKDARKKRPDARVLTGWDRIVLRTLVLNLLFVGGIVWARPEVAFTALSTRGDWFIEHTQHPLAERVRPYVFTAADGLQWLYEAAHDNPYAEMVEGGAGPGPGPTPAPTPSAWSDPWKRGGEGAAADGAKGGEGKGGAEPVPGDSKAEPVPGDSKMEPVPGDGGVKDGGAEAAPEDSPPAAPASPTAWPSPAVVHPAVVAMPAEAKASVAEVGRYLREKEVDPARRVKAIHDFAAVHLEYDAVALAEGRYPDQSAEAVLKSGLAVCAGYANLMKAVADVTGDEVVVVVGDARGQAGEVDGEPHAWNAARLDGLWYLIDSTWDAGHVKDGKFVREYATGYLFVPPELIGITHFPEDPAWQLRKEPLGRGEFARQPMMRPEFFAEGLVLEGPQRSQVTVQRDFSVRLGNPRRRYVLARAIAAGASNGERCTVSGSGSEKVEILCSGLAPGTYNIRMCTSPVEYGSYGCVGEIQVNVSG